MGFLGILKLIAGAVTIATGLLSLIKPRSVYGFTGLRAEGGRGITEIHSILGALFIGLGTMVIIYRLPETYTMLGVTYLVIALVRAVSMFIDKSLEKSNLISLVSEIILGVILVIPG